MRAEWAQGVCLLCGGRPQVHVDISQEKTFSRRVWERRSRGVVTCVWCWREKTVCIFRRRFKLIVLIWSFSPRTAAAAAAKRRSNVSKFIRWLNRTHRVRMKRKSHKTWDVSYLLLSFLAFIFFFGWSIKESERRGEKQEKWMNAAE